MAFVGSQETVVEPLEWHVISGQYTSVTIPYPRKKIKKFIFGAPSNTSYFIECPLINVFPVSSTYVFTMVNGQGVHMGYNLASSSSSSAFYYGYAISAETENSFTLTRMYKAEAQSGSFDMIYAV